MPRRSSAPAEPDGRGAGPPPGDGDEGDGGEAPPERGLRAAVSAFHHRNFAVFWTGALLSNIGSWMQRVTIPYVLYELTGSATVVGIGGFLQFFPVVLVGPLAGSVADRFPRRRVLMVTQSAMAVLALVLWAAWELGMRAPAGIIAVVAGSAVVAGLNIASWQAFVPELVPRHQLLNAVTLNSAQFNGARAVGPALAGVVLLRWGPGAAFLVNAVSYLAVIVALAMVRVPVVRRPRPERRVLGQFAEGLDYVRRSPVILGCIAVAMTVTFLGMPLLQLMAVFAEEVYGVGEGAYGLLVGAIGTGGVLAAAVVTGWLGQVRRSRLLRITLLVYGVSLVAFSQARTLPLGLAMAVVVGMCHLVTVTSLNTTVQLLVDEEVRGRVMAIWVMGFTLANPVGVLLQGWVTDHVGAPITVTAAGLGMVALGVVLVVGRRMPAALDVANEEARRAAGRAVAPSRARP